MMVMKRNLCAAFSKSDDFFSALIRSHTINKFYTNNSLNLTTIVVDQNGRDKNINNTP